MKYWLVVPCKLINWEVIQTSRQLPKATVENVLKKL